LSKRTRPEATDPGKHLQRRNHPGPTSPVYGRAEPD
jgi:hypothetical protein